MFEDVVSLDADDTHCYPTDTQTDTLIINNNKHTDTVDTTRESTHNDEMNEKTTSLCVQTSKQGIKGIRPSLDIEKQGNRGCDGVGNGHLIKPNATGNTGIDAMQRHIFDWAVMWEKMYNTSLNSSNVVDAAMEYCRKHSYHGNQVDDVLAMFRKYAKIPRSSSVDPLNNMPLS